MTYQEKLDWLRKIFSNDPTVRAEAMNTEVPQPLFESQEDFARALKAVIGSFAARGMDKV